LKPGEGIDVGTAIRAIVTKSANDVAVMVAEMLGGDELAFAQQMNAKARALGMMHTNYHNASGLPDEQQITTARDQAILGRAIHDRFPQYFHYFSVRTFVWRGKMVRNHNHLLGAVDGVDGLKTGYIRESGFNIIVSLHRDHRHLVAVVFGGRTASARDARVTSLINNNVNVASTKRTAPLVVEGWHNQVAHAAPKESAKPAPEKVAAAPAPAPPPTTVAEVPAPSPGSTDPIRPVPVKTVNVQPGTMQLASLSPLPSDSRKLLPAPATAGPATVTTVATVKAAAPVPPAKPVQPEQTAQPLKVAAPTPPAKPAQPDQTAHPVKVASASATAPIPAPASQELAAKPHGGWMIQVGAFDDEAEAKKRLGNAQDKARDQLGKADGFTERVAKGDKSLFRARFAGLDKDQAEAACKHLKVSEIPCMLIKN
jgi:D-alanyl-D-alanine carboxypeptidase